MINCYEDAQQARRMESCKKLIADGRQEHQKFCSGSEFSVKQHNALNFK